MRFYKDIVEERDPAASGGGYHYHEWSPRSIESYWRICTLNPFIREQFYPKLYWEDLLEWAEGLIPIRPSSIADIGCGNGNLIECITRVYPEATVHGVDLSEECLEHARERFGQSPRIHFKIGSLDRLPFRDGSLDLLTCTEVLEHTFPETFERSFAEVARVLKKGGFFLASIPFEESAQFVCCPECASVFTPYQHVIFEITRDEVSDLLRKNGLRLASLYESLDRSPPKNPAKKLLKRFLIGRLPRLAKRLFPKAGVSGFLAEKAP